MKALLLRLAVVLAVVAGIDQLADITQSRPDDRVPGTETTLRYTVETRGYRRGEDAAAEALWAVCMATVRGEVTAAPHLAGDAYEVRITPQLGHHTEKRLVGCLEDATLDRVIANVIAVDSTS